MIGKQAQGPGGPPPPKPGPPKPPPPKFDRPSGMWHSDERLSGPFLDGYVNKPPGLRDLDNNKVGDSMDPTPNDRIAGLRNLMAGFKHPKTPSMRPRLMKTGSLAFHGVKATAREALNSPFLDSPWKAMLAAGATAAAVPMAAKTLAQGFIPQSGLKFYIPGNEKETTITREMVGRMPAGVAGAATGIAGATAAGLQFLPEITRHGFGRAKNPGRYKPESGLGSWFKDQFAESALGGWVGYPEARAKHKVDRFKAHSDQAMASRPLGDKVYGKR